MKIAYIISPTTIASGRANGIRKQAEIWKKGLSDLDCSVDLLSSWGDYNLREYDIIHIFGNGMWVADLVNTIYKINRNIVLSPIIDTSKNTFLYKMASHSYCKALKMYSSNSAIRIIKDKVACFLVRSHHEYEYICRSYGVSDNKISTIPLSYRITPELPVKTERKDYCFHLSSLWQDRKNVKRLVQAAIKYNFNLVLAGSKGTNADFEPINKLIQGHNNITVLDFVPDSELLKIYSEAKVFALPSIDEGVGLVALEAAVAGCEIVITNIGGPKEYYGNLAHQVNPYSVDDIGQAILKAMNGEPRQPILSNHIRDNYSIEKLMVDLKKQYQYIINASETKA